MNQKSKKERKADSKNLNLSNKNPKIQVKLK
jgi:hypothetical protein